MAIIIILLLVKQRVECISDKISANEHHRTQCADNHADVIR